MKRNQTPFRPPEDTPATRKQRLQQRLQEISDKSEKELRAISRSLDKVRTNFRPKPIRKKPEKSK